MEHLRTFSPWIGYFVATAIVDWRLGLAVGLAIGIGVLVTSHHGIDLISAASTAFMALLLPLAILDPTSVLHRYTAALALGFLGATAVISILVHRPFTEAFARRDTPRAFWDTDLFRHANRVITAAWATSFLVTAVAVAVLVSVAPDQQVLAIAIQVAGFVGALRFTAWYRAHLAAGLRPETTLSGASALAN